MHVEKEGHKYCVILCSNGAIKNTPEVRLMATKLLETIQWRGRSLGRLPLVQMPILKQHKHDQFNEKPNVKNVILLLLSTGATSFSSQV